MSTPEELFNQYINLPIKILNKTFKSPNTIALSKRLQLEDLQQYCYLGLWRACNEFDPAKKVKFTSFAINHIRWSLFSNLKSESVFRRYKDKLHTDEGNAVDLLDLDASPDEDDDITFHEICPSDADTLNEVEGNFLHEFVFSRITDRQKKIIELRTEGYSLREIGTKVGIGREMVRLEILKVKNLVIQQYGEVV